LVKLRGAEKGKEQFAEGKNLGRHKIREQPGQNVSGGKGFEEKGGKSSEKIFSPVEVGGVAMVLFWERTSSGCGRSRRLINRKYKILPRGESVSNKGGGF